MAKIASYIREVKRKFSKLEELIRRGEDIEKRLFDLIREGDESIEYLKILRSIPRLAEPLDKFVEETKRCLLEKF